MVKTTQMKKNLIKIVMLFLAFSGLINILYSQIIRDTEIRSRYFGYINFKWTHIPLPDTVLKLPLKNINTENGFIQGTFFDAKQKLKVFSDSLYNGELFSSIKIEWSEKQKVPETFVDLLCENDMVSIARDNRTGLKFSLYHSIMKDTLIQHFKERNEFWFLGKIPINPNFDSYLILTKETDTSGFVFIRSLFLLNVKNNRINSLIQVAYTEMFEGEGPYFFTKASSQGKYCYYGIYYSNCIYINRFGKRTHIPKEEKYTYYSFDDNGYVQLHELKGRKKLIVNKYKYKSLKYENIR